MKLQILSSVTLVCLVVQLALGEFWQILLLEFFMIYLSCCAVIIHADESCVS